MRRSTARNPRTASRHIAGGTTVDAVCAGDSRSSPSLVFLLAAWELGPLCFMLAPLALGIVFSYSFSKRFTHFSHLVLGFCLGIAPAAAWIAVRGTLDPRILWLTAAVMFWTAGFDVIYACQDYEFDCARRAVQYSEGGSACAARWCIARFLHVVMIVCLVVLVLSVSSWGVELAGWQWSWRC